MSIEKSGFLLNSGLGVGQKPKRTWRETGHKRESEDETFHPLCVNKSRFCIGQFNWSSTYDDVTEAGAEKSTLSVNKNREV